MGADMMASAQLDDLKAETAQLTAKNQEMKEKIGKIEHLDALRVEVEHKLKIVDQLQKGRFHSLMTLNEIAQVIPKNVWLTSIKDKSEEVELKGLAESNKAVANFMPKLDKSSLFSNVKLQGIRRVEVEGIAVRRFTLNLDRVSETPIEVDEAAEANKKGET